MKEKRGNLRQWDICEGGEGGIWDNGTSVKEERGDLRQWDICEGEEGEFETAGHL